MTQFTREERQEIDDSVKRMQRNGLLDCEIVARDSDGFPIYEIKDIFKLIQII